MEPLETIKSQIVELRPILQEDYHIIELGIFGSYVRGEQTPGSDVDILIEFAPDYKLGLITYGKIESYISDKLGIEVDLVMKRSLKPYIGKRILQEVISLGLTQERTEASAFSAVQLGTHRVILPSVGTSFCPSA